MELYRAVYCGLCRTMRKRCGFFAGMVLNYDFTFLALLLAPKEGLQVGRCHRCPVHPMRCTRMCTSFPVLETVADESVILAYHQLCDTVADEHFFRGIPARILRLLLYRGYRKAAERQKAFDQTVTDQLARLRDLENEHCASLDAPADAFASILQTAAIKTGDPSGDRAMAQLLYHLGRWIYLLDARDDLARDRMTGSYNPILFRFHSEEDADSLVRSTLARSLDLMRSACALLDLGPQDEIVNNVLWLGLPTVCQAVFDGRWAQVKKHRIWRSRHE